jgi:hypothetical protein
MDDKSLFDRVRRNHALEHATVHMLQQMHPNPQLIGRSDWDGFYLYGDIDTDLVTRAASRALHALQEGHRWLAVHPRCGTNLATTALLSGGAAYLASNLPTKNKFLRGVAVVGAALAALAVGKPLGLAVQRHVTTNADLATASIQEIRREMQGNLIVHRIVVS